MSGTVAFIPARGGSKGLPKKNILPFCGKPLIAWSIEEALQSELVSDVVVSTDCNIIAEISSLYGAMVPFLRPEEISGDTATTESAMVHFCKWAIEKGFEYKNILLVQATSPIRDKGVFDKAINHFNQSDSDSLLSVSSSHRFFWKGGGEPKASYDYQNRPRRQDISDDERYYIETGSFYITKIDKLLETNSRLCGKISLYETKEEESYEIDSLTDFLACEVIQKHFSQGK